MLERGRPPKPRASNYPLDSSASGSVAKQARQPHTALPAPAQHSATDQETHQLPLFPAALAVVVSLVIVVLVPFAEQVGQNQTAQAAST